MRISKKILAIALSILMAVSMMPFTVFAADDEVAVGSRNSETVSSLADAIDSIASGSFKSLYLKKDISVTETFVIDGNKKVFLYLDGNDITSTTSAFKVESGSALYVYGSATSSDVAATVDAEYNVTVNDSVGKIQATSAAILVNGGTFGVYRTNITSTGNHGIYVTGDASKVYVNAGTYVQAQEAAINLYAKADGSINCTNATINVSGANAVLQALDNAVIFEFGNAGCNSNTINISNGTLIGRIQSSGYVACGVAHQNANTLNISGGKIVVFNGVGVLCRAGDANITGGEIITSGSVIGKVGDSRVVVPCSAVCVDDGSSYPGSTSTVVPYDVDITGGTFTSDVSTVQTVEKTGQTTAADRVDITGGTFTANGAADDVRAYFDENTTYDNGNIVHYVAEANNVKYASLEEAIDAISTKTTSTHTNGKTYPTYVANGTVKLLDDCAGNGLIIGSGSNLTIDFNGKTYNINGELVGSNKTEYNGFQLLKDSKITLKNGALKTTKNTCSILIQNYSDLTLDNMNVTLNMNNGYAVSNNCGDTVIKDSTVTNSYGYAFDVCRYANYDGVSVTVTGNSTINGNVAVTAPGTNTAAKMKLDLQEGKLTGNIKVDAKAEAAIEASPEKAEVKKANTFTNIAPVGLEWHDNGNGTSVLVDDSHTVAMVGDDRYDTLKEAIDAISTTTTSTHTNGRTYTTYVANGTVKLVQDCAGDGIIIGSGSNLTIDFNGHTYDIKGEQVGSNKTERNGFQLLKDSDITFKNGTLTTTGGTWYQPDGTEESGPASMLIQNYSNLKLTKMTLSAKGQYYNQYTLSNNNGNVVINNTTINAADYSAYNLTASDVGSFAFDVCRYANYDGVSVTVKGTSVINGDVEVTAPGSNANATFALTLEKGTMNGDIFVDEKAAAAIEATPEKAEVTKKNTFSQDPAEGFKWVDNGDGTSSLEAVEDSVSITTADKVNANIYIEDTGVSAIKYTFNQTPDEEGNVQEEITVPVSDLTKNAQGQYEYTIEVAPAQIKDNITVKVINNNNEVDRTYNTSVAGYCDQIIAGDYDAKTKALAKAVLDYGKAASAFFDYNTAAFTADYNNADAFDWTAVDKTNWAASITGDITVSEVRYVATATPDLRFVVGYDEATAAKLTAETNKGYEAKFVKVEDAVILQVTGIPAAKLNETITVTVSDGSTITYTPLIYAYNASKSDKPALAQLGNSIGFYWQAADAVFNV